MQVIGDRPGVTVAELAAATGIAKNVVYGLTRTLSQQGLIERIALPGDSIGFRVGDATEDASAEGADGDASRSEEAAKSQRTRRGRRAATQAAEADLTGESDEERSEESTEPAPAA